MQQRRTAPQSPSLGGNESPFSYSQRSTPDPLSSSSGRNNYNNNNRASARNLYTPRTNAALEENSFINDTSSQLDAFIAQGQAVLGNLGTQRDVLKGRCRQNLRNVVSKLTVLLVAPSGTQRRLLSAANTMGLSREVIGFIERRGRGDMAVFIVGSLVTLVSFIMIIRYLG